MENGIQILRKEKICLIDIPDDTSFKSFIREKKRDGKLYNLPIENMIFLESGKLAEQKIYILSDKNESQMITLNSRYFIISEKSKIHNIDICIDQKEDIYRVILNNKRRNCVKEYRSDSLVDTESSINKKYALTITSRVLEKLCSSNQIRSDIFSYKVYESLLLIPNRYYFPVIANDIITLSWPFRRKENDVNKQINCDFDIVLNSTLERIGNISFDYTTNDIPRFNYAGNVSYSIDEKFRNNGYATMALDLLKKLLLSNQYDGSKDLYASTVPSNIASQKVATRNDGILIYNGYVPKSNSLNYYGGIDEVNIYKIKI